MEENKMTLIKFKNSGNADRISSLPSFYNDVFKNLIYGNPFDSSPFMTLPAVNISESDDKFVVELAAPGLKKEDFKIEVEERVLKISAESKTENKSDDKRYSRSEFSYASFSRSFNLPELVSADSISAEYQNGVLAINLPKREEAKPKPVREIKVS